MFKLTENPDDGEIITSKETEMTHVDNVRTVYHKITFLMAEMILEQLPNIINGNYKSIPQVGNPTYFPKEIRMTVKSTGIKVLKKFIILFVHLQIHIQMFLQCKKENSI